MPTGPSDRTAQFYVSPEGKDTWSGRYPEPRPGRKDGPFATLERARDAVRQLKGQQDGRPRPVRVLLRGGVYELPRTLVFTEADSGVPGAPITYAAYPGERPVLSGGRRITHWTRGAVNGRPCWIARLPEVAAGEWYFTQLFVNGERAPRPRRPYDGWYRFTHLPEGPRGMFQGVRSGGFAPGQMSASWHNLRDVELVTIQYWFDSHVRLQSVDEAAQVVTFDRPTIGDLFDEKGEHARFYLENIFEELTEPGQWYLDRHEGVLYYLPRKGDTPDTTEIVAPRLSTLLDLVADRSRGRVAHLRFEGLDLRHAEWRLPEGNPGAVQGAFNIPGAVKLSGAEDCTLCGCHVSRISQYAIEVQMDSRRNRILGCTLYDLGAGGIKINHESYPRDIAEPGGEQQPKSITGTGPFIGMTDELVRWLPAPGCRAPVAGVDVAPGACTEVADCIIRDGGLIYPSAHGVWIGDSGGNYIHHNEIAYFRYSAISSGWSWSYAPTHAVANRIEYNHLHHIGLGVMSDLGAIYTLGLHPGGQIRGNLIHDISAYGYGGWGIYLDQGSSYFHVEDNIVYRTQGGGFMLHYGRDNVVRNNIFALSASDEVNRTRGQCSLSFVFERNMVWGARNRLITGNWQQPSVLVDHNLYWTTPGTPLRFVGMQWTDWQARGYDVHSLLADPLFSDPMSGHFTLPAQSPAISLGFRPAGKEAAGPRLRTQAYAGREPAAAGPLLQNWFEEGPPSSPTAADYVRLRDEPEAVTLKRGATKVVSFTVRNVGNTPAQGRITFRVRPAGTATVSGPKYLRYSLAPGQESAVSFRIKPGTTTRDLFLEAWPDDGRTPPSLIWLTREQTPQWVVPKLNALTEAAAVGTVLAAVKPLAIRWNRVLAASVRVAVAGDQLALWANVRDVRREQVFPPWEGSCLEIFGSSKPENKIGQVILQPATDSEPAHGWRQAGGCRPEPAIRLHTTKTPDGYELSALIPLELLAIDPQGAEFLLEIGLTTCLPESAGEFVRPRAFRSLTPPVSNTGYARVRIR